MQKDKLLKLVGKEWFDILNTVLSPEIVFEIDGIKEQFKQGKVIYPEMIKVWKAFQQCPLHKLRVVLIGQDPYNNLPEQSTGLAFECGVKTSPSYSVILEAFQDCYPDHFNTKVMDSYLQPWANMGVLLLNTALTVEAGKPNSHKHYWEKFSKKLLYILFQKDKDLIFVAIGKQAQEYITHPSYKDAHIMKLEHPAYATRNNRKWKHKDFFLRVNSKLKSLDREEIDWNYGN